MSKLSYEERIEIYNKRKEGETLKTLQSKYGMTKHNIQYLVWLIDKHGFDILRTTKNKEYPKQFKADAINRVLIDNEPIQAVAIDIGLLSDGMLHNWIKKYKEFGYDGLVNKKKPGNPLAKYSSKKNLTKEEQLEYDNMKLRIENEMLKKGFLTKEDGTYVKFMK